MSILLKNNFERIKHHKAVLLIACIIMPLLICAAVFISNHSTTQEVIAVSGGTVSNPISCDQYTFVHVDQEPALSTLVDGTYAAYAQKRADGTPRGDDLGAGDGIKATMQKEVSAALAQTYWDLLQCWYSCRAWL